MELILFWNRDFDYSLQPFNEKAKYHMMTQTEEGLKVRSNDISDPFC